MPNGDPTAVFEAHRARLLRIAYRMTGSMADAEDVVQDAWLRWQQADQAAVREPGAFLNRIVARLCLDAMKSARARREVYVGDWLPEPLVERPEAPRADELTLSLMLVLERLSPLERAAFLLHDVFAVPLNEVAVTLDRAPAAVRQLASRARQHVQAARPRYTVRAEEGERIAAAFFRASSNGDIATLRSLLAEDVVMRSDGGGQVLAWLNPIVGQARILRLYAGLAQKYAREPVVYLAPLRIDGLPGYAVRERGGVLQTTAVAIDGGRITGIYITRNPQKLARVAALIGAGPRPTDRIH